MYINNIIKGENIILKSVEESDAEFILELRLDETKDFFFHKPKNDVNTQREWIKLQRDQQGDYYFVVYDANNIPIALASIYNINNKSKDAEFGRWVSKGSTVLNIETVLLLYNFAFDELNLNLVTTKTSKNNIKVVNFWKKLGADLFGEYIEEDYVVSEYRIDKTKYFSIVKPKIENLLKSVYKNRDIEKELLNFLSEILEIDINNIAINSERKNIYEWDSFAHVQIIVAFEDKFKRIIPFEDIEYIERVSDLLKYL